MRILHTSDWHLGRHLESISRLDEQREFINELCQIADEEKINLVLIAGDIFDNYNPPAAAEELFYEAVEGLNAGGTRPVVVIAGNHDNPERLCAASPLSYKNGIILLGYPASDPGAYQVNRHGIHIIQSGPGWMEISVPGCDHTAVILTLPYPSESRLEEVLSGEMDEVKLGSAYSDKIGRILQNNGRFFRQDTVNLITAHIFLAGGSTSESERTIQVGGAMTVDPSMLPANAHYAALGHLHRPQRIKAAPCQARYSGSPLAYSFSEANYAKAVYVIDAIPGKEAEIKEINLSCGKPLRRWEARNIGQALEWCKEGRDKNAWVDLEILTDRILTAEEQKLLRELHPGLINIRPRLIAEGSESLDYQAREGKSIDELFREFYRYRLGVDISDELMEEFIKVLNDEEEKDEMYETGLLSLIGSDAEAAAGLDDGGEGNEA
ncbi:MAG TPA: exonuclease SbcCD subunit D [Clostridiales bacterium]|nr:exonuclease SbcCD subunit D [Clostridiales bacterium]